MIPTPRSHASPSHTTESQPLRDAGRLGVLLKVLRQYGWLFAVDVAIGALFFILQLVPGLALRRFVDALNAPAAGTSVLVLALVAYVGFKLANAVMAAVWMAFDTFFRYRVHSNVRIILLERLMRRPGALPLPVATGDALSRFRDDANEVAEVLGKRGIQLVTSSVVLSSSSIAVLFSISPQVTLLAVLPTFGIAIITFVAGRKVKELRAQNRQAAGDVSALLREVFAAVEIIKLAGTRGHVANRVSRFNALRRRAAVRDVAFGGIITAAQGSVIILGTGLVMLVAAGDMSSGAFTVGDFALFVYSLQSVGTLVDAVGQFIGRYQRFEITRRRLTELTPRRHDVDAVTKLADESVGGQTCVVRPLVDVEPLDVLSLRGVGYDHPDGTRGIRDVDLDIGQGQIVVVTGRIGSGKSTLLRVLLGTLPRSAGAVMWNGNPVPRETLLQPPLAGYVPQAPKAFSDSLASNIQLGEPNEQRLDQALHLAAFNEDVQRLAAGLETPIGPRGHRLSGGQLARMAAARAIFRRPQLLVIDDLSAALDTVTESVLWERLLNADARQTVVVASNRRAVLKRADHVVVMHEGRIVHQGTLEHVSAVSPDVAEILR